ncbi:PIN domain-containing protein [Cryomorpha ignava]|uniref:PIN domain-containing protein n=1 Tax=Cryomorpha ignava TaxID=101383 RepID=A0A7K3WVL9_9FLAO|nr:PIN domain-containing protein [Cryomorpha ignava]NEN25544.1 PIN domain-containing protein [Cryomorpha ignava]
MMTRVFLDTNVVLDFILKRSGFAEDAAIIFDLSERNKLQIEISSLSVNNIDYVLSKLESREKARQIIIKLLTLVEISSVGKSTIKKAAMSDFKDYEDAIQNFSAEEAGIRFIITRNLKDFSKSSLVVQSPKEFLSGFSLQK